METNRDELRRQLRDLDGEHQEAMPKWRDALMRLLVDDKKTPTEAKADVLLGGFNRRRFGRMAGATVAAGTLLAACGSDKKEASPAASTTATAGAAYAAGNKTDITVARTAASLEIFAVSVYDKAITNASALGISKDVGAAATLFRDQHKQHADAFNAAAKQLGGAAFDMANPTATKAFESQIAALKNEQDVLKFAFDLEQIAAQTYQGVGAKMLSTPMLRQTAMSVGGVEARHMAILGMFIQPKRAEPAKAFQPTDKAIDATFFV
jgi:Ferritin-like domain